MGDFVLRLQDEYRELNERCQKLAQFIESTGFDDLDKTNRRLLCQQLTHMESYRSILITRLNKLGAL